MQRGIWRKIKAAILPWRVGVLPGMIVIGLVILVRLTGLLQYLEWSALDSFLRLRPSEPVDERIVIVGINEADIHKVGTYPLPDREIAMLLEKLQAYRPRVIGLDIVRDQPVPPGYAQLAATFKASKNLIGIEKVLPEQIAPPLELPPQQVGFSDAILDADGHLRRSLLGTQTAKGYKFSLTLQLAKAYLATEGISLENGIHDQETMRFGSTELPRFKPNYGGYVQADAGGVQVLLNFRSGRQRFRTLSLEDIKTGNFNPKWLRDRIVIIGITTPSIKDIIITSAIAGGNPEPGLIYGVEIQAHAVSQIISAVLDRRPLLMTWSAGWEFFWLCGWGFLGIGLGRLTQSPLRNLLGVGIASLGLIGLCYLLLVLGWWLPVVPAMLVLVINGIGLTAFYQYDRAMRSRIRDRQFIIERTFDTIHNGPLQTLAKVLKQIRDQDLPSNQLLKELEYLNYELRAVYESLQRETLTQGENLCLGCGLELDLQNPLHEVLYQVYSYTLERDFPCFKTLKVKVPKFDLFECRHLSTEQKRGLCRFLEEALCNVGKHAKGVTRLSITYTQESGWYILRITDNGQGICSFNEGRGTQQSRNLARQLRGKFRRLPLSPQGTLCELTWPVTKFLFW
ncbi:MAG: CHASE2 domain-containing protein [Chroococcidiopsidaceae cyanobacterium CP_BM_ER_R8_30]|nr:CHASE2 domain-containing protein [Chroococcidiopsidaceae cyanobacterium CP_BM_ER_R8_30]